MPNDVIDWRTLKGQQSLMSNWPVAIDSRDSRDNPPHHFIHFDANDITRGPISYYLPASTQYPGSTDADNWQFQAVSSMASAANPTKREKSKTNGQSLRMFLYFHLSDIYWSSPDVFLPDFQFTTANNS